MKQWSHMVLVLPAFMMLAGCDPIGSGRPDSGEPVPTQEALVVSPALLEFGSISVIEDGFVSSTFTITNAGDQTVAVHGHDEIIALEGDAESVFEVAANPIFELSPGDSQQLSVQFLPSTEGSWAAEIRVNYGVELLRLEAQAVAPVISVEPPLTEAVPVGCEQTLAVPVENAGSEALVLSSLVLTSGEHFRLGDDVEAPLTIEPDDSTVVNLSFAPQWTTSSQDTRSDELLIESNDPLVPAISAALEHVAYWGSVPAESFLFAPGIETDLLFVVDTDGVMGIYAEGAHSALTGMVDALDQGNVDLHAAVVDHTSTCPATWPAYTTSDDAPSEWLELLREGFDSEGGWGSSSLGDHAVEVLSHGGEGGCMEGFLRDGAQLHIVLVAGDQDTSLNSTQQQIENLRAVAPQASDLRVSVLVPTSTEACSGVSIGAGYMELAAETGGAIEDLCQDDWSASFLAFSDVSIEAQEGELLHTLATTPVLESLGVTAGGVEIDEWVWESDLGAIRFTEDTPITAGEWVEVSYAAAVECAEP